MSFLFGIIFVVFSVYGSSGCDMEAPLPNANSPLDFNKFKGTWYGTVTSMDYITMNAACFTLANIHLTPTGLGYTVTEYYDNGKKVTFHVHAEHTEDGYFRQVSMEHDEDVAVSYDENGNINLGAALEQHKMKSQKYTLLGDFDHYIGFVVCLPTGWAVLVYTKENAITPETLVYVHNDLLKYGISIPLRLGRCQDAVEK